MNTLTTQTLRLTADVAKRYSGLAAANATEQMRFARGSGLVAEVTVLENGAAADLTYLASATMQLKATNVANGTLAMTKVGVIDAPNSKITFTWPQAETDDTVFGTPDATGQLTQHWAVVFGQTLGGERMVLATGLVSSYSAGVSTGATPPPSAGTLPTLEQIQALLGAYVPFNVPVGKAVRFLMDDGNALVVGASRDASGRPVKVMDWENPQD